MSFRVAAGARAALGQNSLPWKAVSYNCQCLTGRRGIGTIVRALSASVVGCQGTRLSARKHPGTLPARWEHQWKETQQGYNIMHWTRAQGALPGDPAGVSIALEARRFPWAACKATAFPGGTLQGRGGFLRMHRPSLYDLGIFVLYAHNGRGPEAQVQQRALWKWMCDEAARLPQRCELIVLADANVHVGSILASDVVGRPLVGDVGAQLENCGGGIFRDALSRSGLTAVNTTFLGAGGPTWSGGARAHSRVDYLMIRADSQFNLTRVWIDYATAVTIQLSTCLSWLDHAPVCATFRYRCWFDCTTQDDPERCTRAQAQCLLHDPVLRAKLVTLTDQEFEERADILDAARDQHNVDAQWNEISGAVSSAMRALMPELRIQTACYSDPGTAAADDAHRRQRAASAAQWEFHRRGPWLSMVWCAWREHMKVRAAARALAAARIAGRAAWKTHMADQLATAAESGDGRELWRLSYCMTTAGFRKKRRWRASTTKTAPSLDEWTEQLALPGYEGGQLATPAWRSPTVALHAFWGLAQDALVPLTAAMQCSDDAFRMHCQPVPVTEIADPNRLGLQDFIALLNNLQKARRGHAVPTWSAPRCAWSACLFPHDEEPASLSTRQRLRELCVNVRLSQSTPLQWQTSWTYALDKHNGVFGCRGWRRLEIFDPVSTSWAFALWQRRWRMTARTQYAYVHHRQRAHAALLLRLQMWKVAQRRQWCAAIFWDQTNAFPSTLWECLDCGTNIAEDPWDGWLLARRYRDAFACIHDDWGSTLVLRPLCGDRQGDGPAAQRYVQSLDPILEAWDVANQSPDERSCLSFCDPWTGEHLTAQHIQFADDTAKVTCAADPVQLALRVQSLKNSLRAATIPSGIDQNDRKLQILLQAPNRSMAAHQNLLAAFAATGMQPNIVRIAKHLGYGQTSGASGRDEVQRALARSNCVWCAWHGFWHNDKVPLAWRSNVYRGTVQAACVDGLEIACITEHDLTKLEGSVCKKLRSLLLGEARSHSNLWLRQKCHIYTVRSLLHRRRCLLFQSILQMMGRLDAADSDLPGVLLGDGPGPEDAQLTADGSPRLAANPWLRQYYRDIQEANVSGRLGTLGPHPCTWMDVDAFATCRFKHVLRYDDPMETLHQHVPVASLARLPCPMCPLTFVHQRAVTCHVTKKHTKDTPAGLRLAMITLTNQCVWCHYIFANVRCLRDHVRKRDAHGACPRTSKVSANALVLPRRLACPRCGWHARDAAELLTHTRLYVDAPSCPLCALHRAFSATAQASVPPQAPIVPIDGNLGERSRTRSSSPTAPYSPEPPRSNPPERELSYSCSGEQPLSGSAWRTPARANVAFRQGAAACDSSTVHRDSTECQDVDSNSSEDLISAGPIPVWTTSACSGRATPYIRGARTSLHVGPTGPTSAGIGTGGLPGCWPSLASPACSSEHTAGAASGSSTRMSSHPML